MAPPPSTPTPPDLYLATCKHFTLPTDDEPAPPKPLHRPDRDRSPELELQRWLDLSG